MLIGIRLTNAFENGQNRPYIALEKRSAGLSYRDYFHYPRVSQAPSRMTKTTVHHVKKNESEMVKAMVMVDQEDRRIQLKEITTMPDRTSPESNEKGRQHQRSYHTPNGLAI